MLVGTPSSIGFRSLWWVRRLVVVLLLSAGALWFACSGLGHGGPPPEEAPVGPAETAPGQPTADAAPAASSATPVAAGKLELRNLALPVGVDRLAGIVDEPLDRPIAVQLLRDGEPVPDRTIRFVIAGVPSKAGGQALSAETAVTDASGKAQVEFTIGSKHGTYVVLATVDGDPAVEPVRVPVEGRQGTWVLLLVFGLLGGLGLFLLGMELSGDGLKAAAGDRMRSVLSGLTSNRFLGVIVGAIATAILQSSSASTVMLVGFVSATMMTLAQALGVILGAKIGTTITAQLIAFNIAEYSLILVAIGFLLRVAFSRRGVRQAGVILLGFGLIFFGLGVMGEAMKPLRSEPAFTELLASLGTQPLLAVLVATAFTAIIQSSAATIGLAIALCAGGVLSLEAALPIAWGAHIGTCATALLSSLGTGREGKQVAVAHLLLSTAGVAVAFPFLPYLVDAANWMTAAMGSTSVARAVANGHTIFTVFTGFFLVLFARQFEWLTLKIVPPLKGEPPFGPQYINDVALDVPAVALEGAHREILRMAGLVRGMMTRTAELLGDPTEEGADDVARADDKVDILEKAVRPFLNKIAQRGLEPPLAARARAFVYVVQDLEQIGDTLTKEVAAVVRKLAERKLRFSPEGLEELRQYHGKLVAKFDRVVQAVEKLDRTPAEQTVQLGFKERILERRLREAHLGRLQADRKESLDTSALHLSVLGNYRTVGDKLDHVARTVLEEL
jgi:phosphate:Na+ symporter